MLFWPSLLRVRSHQASMGGMGLLLVPVLGAAGDQEEGQWEEVMAGSSGQGLVLMGSCRKAKETGLQPCCCAIFVQGNNRNSAVNKNRQVKNFPSLSLLISFLMRNYPTPEE